MQKNSINWNFWDVNSHPR